MKHILLSLLILSVVPATGSVSHASSPPEAPALPKIEFILVDDFSTFHEQELKKQLNALQLECVEAFKYMHYDADVPTLFAREAWEEKERSAQYVPLYSYQYKSLCNYWQGPPPYGNV